MKRRYKQVELSMWDGRNGCWIIAHTKQFKTLASAQTYGEKLSDRHCHVTRYERHGNFVHVDGVEVQRHYDVPTVGDLGYW